MDRRRLGVAQGLIATAASIWLLYYLRTILIPLVIAFVLTVMVDALVKSLQKRWPTLSGWIISFLAALVIMGGIGVAIYVVAQGGAKMVEQGPALIGRVEDVLNQVARSFGREERVQLTTVIGKVSVPQLAGQILAGVQGLVSALFIVLVYFGFMLAERTRVPKKVHNISGSSERSRMMLAGASRIAADIQTYVWVQTLTGIMLALASCAIMLAVGLDNAFFWTFILFLLSFIPLIGVTVGSVAPALFALLQFETFWPALLIFGGIQVAATLIGNVVYPRMQAETQNISSLATLLSLAFWTFLWGLPGSFLAVPLTLMMMMVFANFPATRWIAVLLSNDGNPNFPKMLPTGKSPAKN